MEQAPIAYAPSLHQDLAQGLSKLRKASLLNIVSSLIMGVGITALLVALFGYFGLRVFRAGTAQGTLVSVLTGLIVLFTFFTLGGILALVATYVYLLPAFNSLKRYDNQSFGTPTTLIKVGYLGGLMISTVGFLIFLSGVAISIANLANSAQNSSLVLGWKTWVTVLGSSLFGVVILVIGGLLLIVGEVGLVAGLFKLNEKLRNSTFLAAAIMFVIGFFVAIATFIGWILVYVASGASISNVERSEEVPYLPPPPPQAI